MPLLNPEDEDPQAPLPPPAANPVPPAGGVGPVGPIAGAPGVPPPEAPGAPGGGGGGGYVAPQLPGLPGFNVPGAPAFNYPRFQAPTMEQVMAGPGYQTRLNSANQQLERSAAAKGMLRSGNTLSDISELTNNFAGQAYDQEFNRALQGYDRAYRGAYDAFAPTLEQWRIRAQGMGGMQRDRYNAELGNWMNQNQPRGGGGGPEFDPSPYFGDLLPPMPPGGAPPAAAPVYPGGGGKGYNPEAYGNDPWMEFQ